MQSLRDARSSLALLLFLSMESLVAQAGELPRQPKLLWSEPVSVMPYDGRGPKGLVLLDLAKSVDRTDVAFLAERDGRLAILPHANDAGPGSELWLDVPPGHYRLLKSANGNFWLAGETSTGSLLASGTTSAYLARLDRSGRVIWGKRFDGHGRIDDPALLPSGDVVVAGARGVTAWLARVAENGRIIWERTFGASNSVAVDVSGDDIAVAGFDAVDKERAQYRERSSVWIFKADGRPVAQKVLREDMNHRQRSSRGAAHVTSVRGDFYIIEGSFDSLAPKKLQITKLDAMANVVWRREIEDSLEIQEGGTPFVCRARLVGLGNGDALVTCPLPDRISVMRFAASDGSTVRASIRPPPCTQSVAGGTFPIEAGDNLLWIFASPAPLNDAASCTFLTTLSQDELR